MMRIVFIFFVLLSVFFSLPVSSFVTRCFLPTFHHGLSNAEPLAELWKVSAIDCLTYCIEKANRFGAQSCLSVVYHRQFSTCQLYAQLNIGPGGAQLVHAANHDLYNRTNFHGECMDGIALPPKQYAVPVYDQSDTSSTPRQNNFHRIADDHRPFNIHTRTITDSIPSQASSTISSQASSTITVPKQQALSLSPSQLKDGTEIWNSIAPSEDTLSVGNSSNVLSALIPFLSQSSSIECSTSSSTNRHVFVVLAGFEMDTAKQAHFTGNTFSYASCIEACKKYSEEGGNCKSINFDVISGECAMYSGGDDSSTRIMANKDKIMAERVCLPAESQIVCASDSILTVQLFKQFTRQVIESIDGLPSIANCIELCLQKMRCKAVSYRNGHCQIHQVSPSLHAESVTDSDPRAVLIENICMPVNKRGANKTVRWSNWSECGYARDGNRVRVRNRKVCAPSNNNRGEHCRPELQVQKCL